MDRDKIEENRLILDQQLILDKVELQTKLFRDRINDFLDQELESVMNHCTAELKSLGSSNTSKQTSQKNVNGRLRDKVFVTRNSLLTDLFEIDHIKTILHIFIVILILLLMSTTYCELNGLAGSGPGFHMFVWSFSRLDVVLMCWLGMQLASFILLYNGFVIWATNRRDQGKWWDYFWLSSYFLYLAGFFYYPALSVRTNNLPHASGCIIVGEQVRLIMKSHGFVRSNAAKVLEQVKGKSPITVPTFSHFLYYFFVPTLIYRDEYPRTSKIRWKFVATNFCHLIASVYLTYILFSYFIKPKFENFGKDDSRNIPKYIDAILNCVFPSGLFLLCVFYALLHAWMNAFAEMLRFGDRQFYTDWWNCTSYASYYRTWNIVIHDYLYTYVYKDILHFSSNRVVAALSVFALSAIIHEYVLCVILGFFFPVMLVLFGGIGVIVTFLPQTKYKDVHNIFFWFSFIFGNGIQISLYCMEFFARKNCPAVSESTFDFLIPRTWACYNT